MGFIGRVKQIVTGKTASEREEERKVNSLIKQKSLEAEYKEREIQNVRLATEKVRIKADAQLRRIKQSYAPRQSSGSSFGSMFGAPRQLVQPKPVVGYRRVKRGKTRRVQIRNVPQVFQQPKRFNVITGTWS